MSGGQRRSVELVRTATGTYRASNAAGASIELGQGEGLMSPVEVLLAAIGACSAVDVDVVTSRRGEPTTFRVHVSGDKVVDETVGNRMQDVEVRFDIAFPDTEQGRQAMSLVPRLVELSHARDCTVSRTVELPTNLRMLTGDPMSPRVATDSQDPSQPA